jgi:DNA polymerase V
MKNGIFTALDLKNVPDEWARSKLTVIGLRTVLELRGKPCLNLEEVQEPRKGIMSSRSFSRYVTELDELQEAISQYTTRAAEKLRMQSSVASNIMVFLQTNTHKLHERQYAKEMNYSLLEPTAFTPELIMYAKALLKKIYKPGYNYIKAGVMLTGIVPYNVIQLNMYKRCDHIKQNRLMKYIDKLNQYWGRDTVKTASAGIKQEWKMRRDYCSPRYTTNWNELLTIKI